MEIDTNYAMEDIYNKLINLLSHILEPMPLNQLGVPEHCRYILGILSDAKKIIVQLEELYLSTLRSYDMNEEF